MQTREPQGSRHATLIVVARANFVDDGERRRFQNLDGAYIEDIARSFEKVVLLAAIYRKGRDPQYEMLQNYTFEFRAPNISVVEVPDARGSRRLGVLLRTFWRQVLLLRRVFADHPRALTYIFFPTYRSAAAALYCRWARRPYLIYSGSIWSENIRLSPRWGKRRPWYLGLYVAVCRALERASFRGATARLFTAASHLREYGHLGGTHRAVPLVRVRPLPEIRSHPLGQPPRLLCIGAINPGKGHDTLYHAVDLLRRKGLETTVTTAGAASSYWKQQLDDLASELNISKAVIHHGWLADPAVLAQLYAESDIFVLPTRSEGFPRVVYEAMGHGVPVVTTAIPNIAEVLEDGRLALLVPPDDPPALARALERLLTDTALRAKLGREGWEWTRELFRNTPVDQFLSIVNSCGLL